ncbi:dTMP kinase [Rhizomicrobium palustre]|uniref:Thymidylate kinase n=1 Tax=Rhizomicrobium palustre TaxID=189966 RepID=A0A846N427_9PROT|nr:dTMP kinase [Rhizomicrobium palustre]NIK89962.1 dTMP kinase [Rhizomicrobium palustre]
MAKPGRFITFEGGEGTGKSTQAKRLQAALAERKISALVTREPGGSPGAEEIRALVLRGEPARWSPLTEALLFYAARADHTERTIKPALAEGKWVICDRFSDSSYAYQGGGRGLARETVRRIEAIAIDDFKPDLTLILDLPVEIGLKRSLERHGNVETRFEEMDLDVHARMRKTYLDIAKRNPSRCVVIDANQDIDAVEKAVFSAVKKRYRLK